MYAEMICRTRTVKGRTVKGSGGVKTEVISRRSDAAYKASPSGSP